MTTSGGHDAGVDAASMDAAGAIEDAGEDAPDGDGEATPEAGDGSLPGTATADSEEMSPIPHLAQYAHDGDPKTRWTAANGATGHYWTLDLGAPQPLSRIEIMWEYPAWAIGQAYDYTVSVSDDDQTYSVVIDKTANIETIQTQVAYFPTETQGQHVRITVTGLPAPAGGNTTWAGIYEVRVYAP